MKESYKRAMNNIHADPEFRARLLQTLSSEKQNYKPLFVQRYRRLILTAASVASFVIVSICLYAFAPMISNDFAPATYVIRQGSGSYHNDDGDSDYQLSNDPYDSIDSMPIPDGISVHYALAPGQKSNAKDSDESVIKDNINGNIHIVSEILKDTDNPVIKDDVIGDIHIVSEIIYN